MSINTNPSNCSIHPSQSKSFASESRRRSGTPNDAIDSGSLASESLKPAAAKASSMDSNILNVGLKQEPQIFLSSSLETRATAKMNFGDAELFEKHDLRLQNDCFEELDMIPTVAKTLLHNGKNESLKKGTDQNDNSDVIISNEKLFNALVSLRHYESKLRPHSFQALVS